MERLFPSGTLSGMRGSLYPLSQTQHLCSLRAMCQNFGILQKMNPRNECGWSYQLGEDPGGLLGRLGHTMASMPTCTDMEEAGICPFTNTCCGTVLL